MSILIGRDTRLVVQGITGREGEFHSRAMVEYGTRIVGTNAAEAAELLEAARFVTASSLDEAAAKAVAAAAKGAAA